MCDRAGCMHGRCVRVWHGSRGACVTGERATAADSTHPTEVVKSTSLSLCPCYVCVIVINLNCQKW